MQTFHNMHLIGSIVKSKGGKSIVNLYENNKKLYILDVVLFTRFQEFYAYETSRENIRSFFQNKNNIHLLPQKNQLVYKLSLGDFEVSSILRAGDSLDFNQLTLFDEKIWKCEDNKQIQLQLKF